MQLSRFCGAPALWSGVLGQVLKQKWRGQAPALEELTAKPGEDEEAVTIVWALLVGHIGRFLF